MTSLREYAGYHGGGSGFGGQLRAWNPPGESVDAALLPNFTRGNARADDLVRNNGYAANAIQLHQDHIVGSFFRLSHRPSWRYLGIGEEEARAFSREVEAAWKEFAEDDCCCIDVERKRTFTMMIREGVAMHAFNGELFVQATWDTSPSRLFRTQFRMVSPKRISNPNNTGDSRNCRAGVQINDSGAALGYYVSEDGYPGWMPQKWTWIPRELPGGRASFIHVFEPVEDGQTRGANVFYSVMEQMKMLDTLQNTQLQSAIVKAMYAATIESELDTQSAMDFILGANSQEQRDRLTGWIGEIAAYYAAAPVRLGGAKVPHLMPGDSLNLQTAQDTDNGYSVFEQSLLRYIAAGLGVSYEQLSRNYAQMSYSTARASANESWAYFMGRRKFVASRQASQMFLCWLEEAIVRRVVTLPSKARFSFQEARSAWGNCDWIGSGRMAIDGLKEVQEPEEYFRMSPEDWLRAEMQGEIVALVHSHPGGLPWLSEADRRLQVQSDLPWWLVCRGEIHKFRCVPHLTGRRFEHGVTDCYTLFRDAYHLAGIEMPDFHREDDWWRHGQNLYLDNLEATGLYQLPLSAAQPGDVLLCCFGSSVPNHAAIYCGDGELLHHIPEQLSKRERYTDKWQRRTHSLWRHRAWRASAFTGICNDLAAASTFV
ncbi:phage portal protein [Escherichia coli]|nr:phage portal protein [Escherichia coli]